MEKLHTIVVRRKGSLATLKLNRPRVHNAMDLQMIRELSGSLLSLNRDKDIRIIVLSSEGENFSTGADLNWMRDGITQGEEQLKKESLELAGLFRTLRESTAVTIASVRGRIMGGAIGLVAASDLVVAEHTSFMAFSEVNLGLIPATIAPHVLRKAGHSRTLDWMLTARAISATEVLEAGLFHRVCEPGSLEKTTDELVTNLLSKGPLALAGVKDLLTKMELETDPDLVDMYNAKLIASFRTSPEGQEGMKAFFEKRKPDWNESP
jgi:methylglutaconyl-CoA hydratase